MMKLSRLALDETEVRTNASRFRAMSPPPALGAFFLPPSALLRNDGLGNRLADPRRTCPGQPDNVDPTDHGDREPRLSIPFLP